MNNPERRTVTKEERQRLIEESRDMAVRQSEHNAQFPLGSPYPLEGTGPGYRKKQGIIKRRGDDNLLNQP